MKCGNVCIYWGKLLRDETFKIKGKMECCQGCIHLRPLENLEQTEITYIEKMHLKNLLVKAMYCI